MKKIQKASELLWVFGIVFVAGGVALCSKADLGVSMIAAPAFVVYDALAPLWSGFTVGVSEYIIQALLLLLMMLLVRKFSWKYLLAFAVAVIYGYTLDLFLWICKDWAVSSVWMRWALLLVGDCVTSFGVACFFRSYMPLQVYELFVAEVAVCFHIDLHKTKRTFDVLLLVLSVALSLVFFRDVKGLALSFIGKADYHGLGVGTLVTTAVNAFLIAGMGKLVDKLFGREAAFPVLEGVLKR